MTDNKTQLILKSALKYKSLETAIRVANRATKMNMVVLGDDGYYWVLVAGHAEYLVRRGYSYAQ